MSEFQQWVISTVLAASILSNTWLWMIAHTFAGEIDDLRDRIDDLEDEASDLRYPDEDTYIAEREAEGL